MKVVNIRGKGRGVIAEFDYEVNQIVEVCPVIPLTNKEYEEVSKTCLGDYVFSWPGAKQSTHVPMSKWLGACVCLGLGSIYNHSSDANLSWRIRRASKQLIFYAVKNIRAGEELTHDYSWPEDKYSMLGVK